MEMGALESKGRKIEKVVKKVRAYSGREGGSVKMVKKRERIPKRGNHRSMLLLIPKGTVAQL